MRRRSPSSIRVAAVQAYIGNAERAIRGLGIAPCAVMQSHLLIRNLIVVAALSAGACTGGSSMDERGRSDLAEPQARFICSGGVTTDAGRRPFEDILVELADDPDGAVSYSLADGWELRAHLVDDTLRFELT